ncbi:restriction endonuclease [Luteimonas sp. BDR2-5]|uniref:restriction endonuclease n=1 Tax=Proluteimonas luteida TaxID=2878685 RepID=UPI001E33C2B2|nr:restriction endonuclease [Luteimonas sp. BDR2-5]MCD9026854.1 restriction endonuclease [Luteimonas sp. BDR2-5]
MGTTTQWIAAIGVMLVVGGLSTAWFMGVQRRRDESAAGIEALSGISWRSFIGMVLQALRVRGYTPVVDLESASGDQDYVLEHDGGRWLLACKHGASFVLGRNAVQALAADVNLQGAAGGLLVTQGRIDNEARGLAAQRRIELHDGRTLWPELREFLPAGQLQEIQGRAAQQARQRTLLSWLLALVAGIGTFLLVPQPGPASATPAPATQAAPAAAAPAEDVVIAPPPRIPVERQRNDLASAVTTLPDVDRALWATQSTLQVYVTRPDDDATVDAICALVLRQPDLTSSRIQLTPPPGSDLATRFLQCRSF